VGFKTIENPAAKVYAAKVPASARVAIWR